MLEVWDDMRVSGARCISRAARVDDHKDPLYRLRMVNVLVEP